MLATIAASTGAVRVAAGIDGARLATVSRSHVATMSIVDADGIRGAMDLANSNAFRGFLAFAAMFRAGAAFAVIDQPRLPPISGSHEHIGVTYSRCAGARVKVFYPASTPSSEPALYCTDGKATSDGMAGLVGFRQLGLAFLLEHLSVADSGAWLDAPPASESNLPLLVYSHGFGGNMDMASYLMREMASHGIVVAAVEHTDGTASYTVGDDGAPQPFAPLQLKRKQQLAQRADELLAAAKPGALSLPAGLSLGDTFIGGHSFGGPAALLAGATAAANGVDVKGLLLHDPALGMGADVWAIRRGPRDLPTLSYVSDECAPAEERTRGLMHLATPSANVPALSRRQVRRALRRRDPARRRRLPWQFRRRAAVGAELGHGAPLLSDPGLGPVRRHRDARDAGALGTPLL